MYITRLQLKQFRCFTKFDVQLDAPIILICGNNGSGKTSLLEALHYGCYLRSFRTHLARQLIAHGQDTFFVSIEFKDHVHGISQTHALQAGFNQSTKKRLVKVDQKAIQTYKQLTDHYRIITLTSDDLQLIHAGPDIRRTFIDQAAVLGHPEYSAQLRDYKQVVANRNALIQRAHIDHDAYFTWTEQLWRHSTNIQNKRQQLLQAIQQRTNSLLDTFNVPLSITFTYKARLISDVDSSSALLETHPQLMQKEQTMKRSLFGAHLDDITIHYEQKQSKAYASRGQQKLTVLLLKIAQLQELAACKGPATLLLDDFMAEFDTERMNMLLDMLASLECQLILTSPTDSGPFIDLTRQKGAQELNLTS